MMAGDTSPRRSVRIRSAPDSSRSELYVPQCRLFSWKNLKPTLGEIDLDLRRRMNSRSKVGPNSVLQIPQPQTPPQLDVVPTSVLGPSSEGHATPQVDIVSTSVPTRSSRCPTPSQVDIVPTSVPTRSSGVSTLLPRRRVLANRWSLSSANTSPETGHEEHEVTTRQFVDVESQDPDKLNVQTIVENFLGDCETDYSNDVAFVKRTDSVPLRNSRTPETRCPSAPLRSPATKSADTRLESLQMNDIEKKVLGNRVSLHRPNNSTACTNISKPTSKSLQLYNLSIWPVTDRGIQRPAQRSRCCWVSDRRDNRWKVDVTDKEWIDMLHASPNDPIMRRLGLCSPTTIMPSSRKHPPMYYLERSRTSYQYPEYFEPFLSSTSRSKTYLGAGTRTSSQTVDVSTPVTDTNWKILLNPEDRKKSKLFGETSAVSTKSSVPSKSHETKTPCNSPVLQCYDEDEVKPLSNSFSPKERFHFRSDTKPTESVDVSNLLSAHRIEGFQRKASSTKTVGTLAEQLTQEVWSCNQYASTNTKPTMQPIIVPY